MPEKEYTLLMIFVSFALVLILYISNKIILSVCWKHENW